MKNDEWSILAPLLSKKINTSASILNNEFIYIIGGIDYEKNGMTSAIEKYSIVKDSWAKVYINGKPKLNPRCYAFSF